METYYPFTCCFGNCFPSKRTGAQRTAEAHPIRPGKRLGSHTGDPNSPWIAGGRGRGTQLPPWIAPNDMELLV